MTDSFQTPWKFWLKFISTSSINNNLALAQIKAWRRIWDRPLSEPMTAQFTDAYMRLPGQGKGKSWSPDRRVYIKGPYVDVITFPYA